MIYIAAILFFIYCIAMGWVILGGLRLPDFKGIATPPQTAFTVIVPFRNEAKNLPRLLQSVASLNYPKELFELILVNDASEDDSVAIIRKIDPTIPCRVKLIQNKRISGSPKKDAITAAILEAHYDWILTTDADCELPVNWLGLYDQFIQKKHPKMICAPVVYSVDSIMIKQFQYLDGLSLQAVTLGGFGWNTPLLCNGANLGFLKVSFDQLKGYQGNDHIASGDDIFLLEKMKDSFPKSVHYLKNKDAAVLTQAEKTWKAVISQRLRWASKTSKQKSRGPKLLGEIVFVANLAFIGSAMGVLFDDVHRIEYAALLFIKIIVDFVVLMIPASFLQRRIGLPSYLANAFIYPLVTVWVVVSSLRGNYQWKGRNFKK